MVHAQALPLLVMLLSACSTQGSSPRAADSRAAVPQVAADAEFEEYWRPEKLLTFRRIDSQLRSHIDIESWEMTNHGRLPVEVLCEGRLENPAVRLWGLTSWSWLDLTIRGCGNGMTWMTLNPGASSTIRFVMFPPGSERITRATFGVHVRTTGTDPAIIDWAPEFEVDLTGA